MKKIFLFVLLAIFIFNLWPIATEAEGIVPCGRSNDPNATPEEQAPCQLCHIFVLFNNIVTFLLIPDAAINGGFPIVPILATAMIVWSGFLYVTSLGNPTALQRSRNVLIATGWGLLIVYGAWAAVNTLTWFGILPTNWNTILCPII